MRTLPAVAAVAITLAAASAAAIGVASAATTPAVRFTRIQYNSPGPDDRTTKSLNGEWFQLTNLTKQAVTMTGWTVKDVAKHTFTLSGTLGAGRTLTVHTGTGTAGRPAGHGYQGSKSYIWNNTGDTATLRTGKGAVVHTCKWGSQGSVTTCGAPTRPPAAPPRTQPATTQPAHPEATEPTATKPGPVKGMPEPQPVTTTKPAIPDVPPPAHD